MADPITELTQQAAGIDTAAAQNQAGTVGAENTGTADEAQKPVVLAEAGVEAEKANTAELDSTQLPGGASEDGLATAARVATDVIGAVGDTVELAKEIHEDDVLTGAGHPAHDLLDKTDDLLSALEEHLNRLSPKSEFGLDLVARLKGLSADVRQTL